MNESSPVPVEDGGRGQDHYEHLAGVANVRVTDVVDIDERHFTTSLPFMKEKWRGDPKTETDFRHNIAEGRMMIEAARPARERSGTPRLPDQRFVALQLPPGDAVPCIELPLT